jgi:hypothetical protein
VRLYFYRHFKNRVYRIHTREIKNTFAEDSEMPSGHSALTEARKSEAGAKIGFRQLIFAGIWSSFSLELVVPILHGAPPGCIGMK